MELFKKLLRLLPGKQGSSEDKTDPHIEVPDLSEAEAPLPKKPSASRQKGVRFLLLFCLLYLLYDLFLSQPKKDVSTAVSTSQPETAPVETALKVEAPSESDFKSTEKDLSFAENEIEEVDEARPTVSTNLEKITAAAETLNQPPAEDVNLDEFEFDSESKEVEIEAEELEPVPESPETSEPQPTNLSEMIQEFIPDKDRQKPSSPTKPIDTAKPGKGLIYHCGLQHWACVDQANYQACQQSSQECYSENVYQNRQTCLKAMVYFIDHGKEGINCEKPL